MEIFVVVALVIIILELGWIRMKLDKLIEALKK